MFISRCGALDRIAGVGGVDHDVGAEFAPDRAGRGLGGIGRPQHVAYLADGLHAFVNQGDALFGARAAGPGRGRIRPASGRT